MRIRLFIYGSSGSGKTSFFRQLVLGNGLQVGLNRSLSKFMSGSVSAAGQVLPTNVGIDGIELNLDRDKFLISDWKGELLSAAINELATGNKSFFWRGSNRAANQINFCDAVLFFFDPTAQSELGSIRSMEQIRRHHCEELLRAKQLIDFVVRVRQNRFVPIIFVLTHSDLVEVIPQASERTAAWVDAVSSYLSESYNEFFSGYYPKSLVCRERLFYNVTLVNESRQPRKSSVSQPQSGTVPSSKVGVVNWVESFPYSVDLADILRGLRQHFLLINGFQRSDRKRCCFVVMLFLFFVSLIFLVPAGFNTRVGQDFKSGVQKRLSPIFDLLPQFQFMAGNESDSEDAVLRNLRLLEDGNAEELDVAGAKKVNESFRILMRRLNGLEGAGEIGGEEYKVQFRRWSELLGRVERMLEVRVFDSDREKLDVFEAMLGKLSDSSVRIAPQLNSVLDKFWGFYRELLIVELSEELRENRATGLDGKQQINALNSRLERYFGDVNRSAVRGNGLAAMSNKQDNGLKEMNQKERLKQDIRKCFKSCENFLSGYPVEIRIREVMYSSEVGIDRNFVQRLKISGNKGNPEYIDLVMATGYRSDKVCQFMPSKERVTMMLNFDPAVHISIEKMYKGSGEKTDQDKTPDQNQDQNKDQKVLGWHEYLVWQVKQHDKVGSLSELGIKFYFQFENEENTTYICEGEGMKIKLEIKRTRQVPDLLWQITK
ncbi:MAG: GTPase domain-containing protein [Planctomycetaceae bacterium]|jgi:hypothetical protein|nr:GTPase domain-containing protein [Planctomycetaceae bacterium]